MIFPKPIIFIFTFLFLPLTVFCGALKPAILHDPKSKTIYITAPDKSISILIDYAKGCFVKELNLKGKNTLSPSGITTGITTQKNNFTSFSSSQIKVKQNASGITLSGITYGENQDKITEIWIFKVIGRRILWDIERTYMNNILLEDQAFPQWNFANLSTFKGGILDNGGMVWCKYLEQMNDTYGVHTGGVTFWDATSGDALQISPKVSNDKKIASKFSHGKLGTFTFTQMLTDTPLAQRYNLSRYMAGHFDVFSPSMAKKGKITISLSLAYVDYFKTYSRGKLPEIDATAVRELLNTTGRYGVIDNNIIGANGWLTNWKCLHEPFFAQIGLAVNDPNYDHNMAATLNQERDEAMLADGRVLSRWHNIPGDEIKGTYNPKTGYYEAMWGYTVDSQTGYVINASELFDLNGDTTWLRSHQKSCEQAINWLIKRDSDYNGIFEMMNNNISEKKASDWLDIVWASYENAFVNAQLYEALNLWANCEKVLGNKTGADYYSKVAERLKTAFNKTTHDGGFWSAEKKQYVYWRDKDGSIHGDNLVTPVNFAAIAFGICDDRQRIGQILDQIEDRSKAENLFHWPLCFDSFKKEEVSGGNWPFPKYENGDIFPTWGYLGIRAYAGYDKSIALKYINNLLAQYQKDGLSSQRYSRLTQKGLGDDILAGISTSITALYRDLYGLRPKWNRMGLEPNMTSKLNGTTFNYTLRGTVYTVSLTENDYLLNTTDFSVKSIEHFGVSKKANVLTYYHLNKEIMVMEIKAANRAKLELKINLWNEKLISGKINSKALYSVAVKGLKPTSDYLLWINGKESLVKSQANGTVTFNTKGQFIDFIIKPTI
jgi:tetratricopeptide (TPR) repeat protein